MTLTCFSTRTLHARGHANGFYARLYVRIHVLIILFCTVQPESCVQGCVGLLAWLPEWKCPLLAVLVLWHHDFCCTFKLELAAVTSPRVSSHICSASVITSYFCMPFCIVFIRFFLRSLLFFADSLSFTHVISIQVYNQSCMFSEKACPAASTPTFFFLFFFL